HSLAEQISGYSAGRMESAAKQEKFLRLLANKIKDGLLDLITTPASLSKLEEKVSFSNLVRIYWYFCRTTLKNGFLLAKDVKLIEKLGNLLGKQINVDNIIHTMEAPGDILNFLSVGFFAARFLINASLLLKHTLAPGGEEKALPWQKRLAQEMSKRHP